MAFFAAITLFVQCKKDSGSENNPPVTPKNYLPVTAGSTFTYHSVINTSATDYTLTATSGDSLVNGKSYFSTFTKLIHSIKLLKFSSQTLKPRIFLQQKFVVQFIAIFAH